MSGDLTTSGVCLGRAYSVEGQVTRGNQRGRTWEVPTANLVMTPGILLPPFGVYLVHSPQHGFGVGNLGIRPTFPRSEVSFEIHFFHYSGPEFYSSIVEVSFLSYLRAEKKFASIEELIYQIRNDMEMAKYVLSQNPAVLDSFAPKC
ncbi:MAG: riboflavin kinase [bacterium]|nr:riboflavin kinase [bacterium]